MIIDIDIDSRAAFCYNSQTEKDADKAIYEINLTDVIIWLEENKIERLPLDKTYNKHISVAEYEILGEDLAHFMIAFT